MTSRGSSVTTTFAFATIFLLASLGLLAVAFATNNWLENYVNREDLLLAGVSDTELDSSREFYTSYRGLFRTCYPEDASFLDAESDLIDGRCLRERGYEIPNRRTETLSYGQVYNTRIHLMRTLFAAFVVAMFFLLVSCITGIVGCWNAKAKVVRATGCLTFTGMFFIAAGMGVFHGLHYLEENELEEVPYTAAWVDKLAGSQLTYSRLADHSYSQYGYSYILGWISLAMAAVAGILYLVVAYKLTARYDGGRKPRKTRSRPYDYPDATYPGTTYPNTAYPYPAEDPYHYKTYPAVYPEAPYVDNGGYDYGYRY